jgi:hypothetical protein
MKILLTVSLFCWLASSISRAQKQPGYQIASYQPGNKKCEGNDMVMLTRMVLPLDQCKRSLMPNGTASDQSLKSAATKGTCSVRAGSDTPTGLSCLEDIYLLPNNTKNNTYLVSEVFASAKCSNESSLLALSALQTQVISKSNRLLNDSSSTPSTSSGSQLVMAACTPGGQLELRQCSSATNLASCKTYASFEDGECADLNQQQSKQQNASPAQAAQSVRYRCIPNGGVLESNVTISLPIPDVSGGDHNAARVSAGLLTALAFVMFAL